MLTTVTILVAAATPFATHAAPLPVLKSLSVQLPYGDQQFPAGPGSNVVNANCLGCHSADEVLNQPNHSKAGWEETVNKMINVYKAPVAANQIGTIVDYLTDIKGQK